MTLQERLRERLKATKWKRGPDVDYATEWEPDQLCIEAAAELDRLQARVAELEADAERLDWFDGNLFTGHWNGVVDSGSSKYWLLRGDWRHQIKDMRGNTFRAAIDTARKAKP